MASSLSPLPLAALPPLPPLQLAVVGHVEVVTFLEVDHLPTAGEILSCPAALDLPAGGGAVVAVQLARLTGRRVPFFTALGRDAIGERAAEQLERLGLELHVAWREQPTRRGITYSDRSGERTITVIGERLNPAASDSLPWHRLGSCDGMFVTAADAPALQRCRSARVLAATPRLRLPVLRQAGVRLDALIGSALDPAEQLPAEALQPPPRLRIATAGGEGGEAWPLGRFEAPPRQHPVRDAYGAGDSFAAGVTAGLAAGWTDAMAISLGCHCGNACLDGLGPYATQLRRTAAGDLSRQGD
ncbi:putative PfkB family carbohydrate kinase [Cyanobium sp. PCC 7001]|uniref:PfkB family carbohydrate kinase n=1 Tax=Cyanobium sp. PCC 7001 TaxID=180281 RepID=UPI00018052A9|nr:PfkB family carbohydrate kinase [Cyanobium sp. PCC 7001]EDY39227.1 putative PfkB family carbohydrate kinase [Cyanobium sp. PCC 7001]